MGRIERIPCGNVNCFLVAEGDSAVLVDTGREAHRHKLLEACRPYRVGLILLTHGHIDHAQNAAFLSRELGAPVAMNRGDLDLLADSMAQPLASRGLLGRAVLAASLGEFRRRSVPPFVPALLLEEGDRLDGCGVGARVIALPGHTAGSIGLVVPGQGVIVGDALMNMGRPGLSLLFGDEAALRRSAGKIGALEEGTVWFGHGAPARNRRWA